LLPGSSTDLVFSLLPNDIATGSTVSTVQRGGGDNFTIEITLGGENIDADTLCEITISGLLNPSIPVPTNGGKIQHKLFTNSPLSDTPYSIVSNSQALLATGTISSDRLRLSNQLPSQQGVTITYSFSYNRQLNVNDIIEIQLPKWGSQLPLGTTSICDNTGFNVEAIGSDFEPDYGLRITLTSFHLKSNTQCDIAVTGMTNPSDLLPANSETIKHRVISTSGGMAFSSISETSAIAEGILSNDSFIVNNAIPSATDVIGTYTFMYDRDLEIADQIILTLPGWNATATTIASNVVVFDGVDTNGVYTTSETNDFAVDDLVTIANCNPATVNNGNFRISALSKDVSITLVNATSSAGIITIANHTGCTIERSALTTLSNCGVLSTAFTITESTIDSELRVVITVAAAKLYRDTPCSISINGFTNPSSILEANSPTLKQSIQSINGNVNKSPIMSTSAISKAFASIVSLAASNRGMGVETAIVLSFKAQANLAIGNKVVLHLPYYGVKALEYIPYTKCGISNVTLSPGINDQLQFTMGPVALQSYTKCNMEIRNIPTPTR
jgi:hypothetical protein